ncbi:MAG: asparagine synthase (glutamine-hydrolyzing) [Flavobacteriales bacterium]|nr:asparagine synthase (glutamine-hydrolyzing) [Flavobacteriales bacterium]
MCGIAGYHAFSNATGSAPDLNAALRAIAHRGPDDEGTFKHGLTALGHRRLRIIDTSAAGHQPFTDDGGRYTIAFNGEVFNFPELRAQLETKGHTFRSRTDTEVVLRLYREEGPGFLHRLNGFFALAIHDKETDELFLARDRFGVKPLHWCEHNGHLLFASEQRALLAMGLPFEVDPVSLRIFLTHYYVPAPHSMLKRAFKLQPGHALVANAQGARTYRWYDVEAAAAETGTTSDPAGRLRELLDDAVRLRLISDVPIGSFLSGGLDSSIIAALAMRHKPDLRTFSIGYTDRYYDETPFAEEMARHIGTDHCTFTLTSGDLAAAYEPMIAALDEPFADQSALPSYVLNQRTRAHVTVALSGDGADELFGGYRKHQAELRAAQPGIAERMALAGAPLWNMLPKSRNSAMGDRIRQLDRFARTAKLSAPERYLLLASWDDQLDARELVLEALANGEFDSRRAAITEPFNRFPAMEAMLWADLRTVLPDDMLHKVDVTSMAHGLEVRTPFLDRRVVELAFSLPAKARLRKGCGKAIVREAFGDLLPTTVLNRAKRGFEVPLTPMLKGPMRHLVESLCDAEQLRHSGLNPESVQRILARFNSADPGSSQATVHALIVFMAWWKKHVG